MSERAEVFRKCLEDFASWNAQMSENNTRVGEILSQMSGLPRDFIEQVLYEFSDGEDSLPLRAFQLGVWIGSHHSRKQVN